jgi:hypothetical protein
MDAPYLDPSRGCREKAGVFVRSARVLGLVMFVTGVILGCYVGLRWLQSGRAEATLIEDVVLARCPTMPRRGSRIRAPGMRCIDLPCGFCEFLSSRQWPLAVS